MSTLRVFLIDDHDIVRKGVRALLESEGDIEIVGEASTIADARRLIPGLLPRVVVLDTHLPDGSGIDLCRDLRTLAPDSRALVLTSDDAEESIVAAMHAGAVGYVLKQVEATSLLSAVRTIASGHSPFLCAPEQLATYLRTLAAYDAKWTNSQTRHVETALAIPAGVSRSS